MKEEQDHKDEGENIKPELGESASEQKTESVQPKDDNTVPKENHSDFKPKTESVVSSIQTTPKVDVSLVYKSVGAIKEQIAKVVIGQSKMLDLLAASVLIGGHCLIEGLPGIGKTLTAKLLAKTIKSKFGRIQFTPDLMPTDITGTSVFNLKNSEFEFKKGPIFASVVLIDEINRSPAKTQAALMEVMEEKQLSYDGVTYPMEKPFFVVATQNPIEQEGTYALPEAQLDRFVFKIKVGYPDLQEEQEILNLFQNDFSTEKMEEVKPVISAEEIQKCQDIVQKVFIKKELLNYIAALVHNTRSNGDLFLGASPRASLAIMKASKAIAAIRGRDFVTPDDIQFVCYPVLNHRVIISHEREMEGSTVEDIIKDIINKVEVPR